MINRVIFIGAVTHVLISDPTRGYGIFFENMLLRFIRYSISSLKSNILPATGKNIAFSIIRLV